MAKDEKGIVTDLVGEIERVTYNDDDSGYTVAQVQAVGRRRSVTVVGDLMNPAPGTILNLKGRWTEHPRFGRQFRVSQFDIRPPVTVEGIEKYLGSGLVKGIGPETAHRIVEHFQEETLEIIDNDPQRLSEIAGIGAKRIKMIANAWQQQQEVRQVMLFLQSHGVSPAYAHKIFRYYGEQTIEMVRSNPYRLAQDVFGIGFMIADKIAAKLGYANDAPLRLQAGILHVLHKLADDGHLYYPQADLLARCHSILESPQASIGNALEVLSREKKIVMEDLDENGSAGHAPGAKAIFLNLFYQCEVSTARQLTQIMAAPCYAEITDTQQPIQWVQKWLKFDLAATQQQAVAQSMTSKVLVITGGPGTGKTTIVRAITRLYQHLHAQVLLAAPTGRAAKRLSEATGHTAKTIHRLLEYNPGQGGFQRDQHNPLEGDLLVVDEASMIDSVLMYHLLKAVPATTTLIFVGDVNQLPSVGPGNVLKDILASGMVPQVTLTDIFRQARGSRIITNAHRINVGKMPRLEKMPPDTLGDFYFITQNDPQNVLSTILTLVDQRIPQRFGFDAIDQIQVLTPMHRGVVGAENLNRQLQERLNPQEAYVSRGEQRFGRWDKVMQIRNNYEKNIFNGDIGRIEEIDAHAKTVSIRFDDRLVPYDFTEMEEVVLAYAISVHKSQGSEYPAVVIPVTTSHYLLLQRNLIYTAITRAKQLVVLVGTRQAMAMAVNNNTPHKRYTRLAQRLQATGRSDGAML